MKYEIISKPESPLYITKAVHFNNSNLRYTYEMVKFMNEAAKLAHNNSTILFLSDTSIPLMPCDKVFSILYNKTTSSLTTKKCTREGLISRPGSWVNKNCTCSQTHVQKGSQWLALPKHSWQRAYNKIDINLCYLSYKTGLIGGAPDEFYIQTQLQRPRLNKNSHYIKWGSEKNGHPNWLSMSDLMAALIQNYPFARKYRYTSSLHKIIKRAIVHA